MAPLQRCCICDGTGREEVLGFPRGEYGVCGRCEGRGVHGPIRYQHPSMKASFVRRLLAGDG